MVKCVSKKFAIHGIISKGCSQFGAVFKELMLSLPFAELPRFPFREFIRQRGQGQLCFGLRHDSCVPGLAVIVKVSLSKESPVFFSFFDIMSN